MLKSSPIFSILEPIIKLEFASIIQGSNMLRQSKRLRHLSTGIFILFLVSLAAALTLAHLFRAPPLTGKEIERYATLFREEDLQDISNIMFKNQLGNYQIEKKNDLWSLKYPKQMEVDPTFVESFLSSLRNIKIKKTFKPDPINMTNFSLNTPLVEIVLIKESGDRKIIRMGLINPVDNSTYLTVSDQNIIYHIDALKTSLNSLNTSDLTESKIFSFSKETLSTLKIFKGDKNENTLKLSFSKNSEGWGSREGSLLSTSKTNTFLDKILALKTLSTPSLSQYSQKKLEELQGPPLITIEMEGDDHKIVTYKIIPLQFSLPEIDSSTFKDKQILVVRASNKELPSFITNDTLSLFDKTEKDL